LGVEWAGTNGGASGDSDIGRTEICSLGTLYLSPGAYTKTGAKEESDDFGRQSLSSTMMDACGRPLTLGTYSKAGAKGESDFFYRVRSLLSIGVDIVAVFRNGRENHRRKEP